MGSMGTNELIGDNKEFAISTAGTEVTIHLQTNETKTSADDTVNDVYFNTPRRRKKFQIRNDQSIQVLGINDFTFTDPESVPKNVGIIEKFDTPIITKIKIKTTTDNTNIKVRVI